jgi:hypothetical protein
MTNAQSIHPEKEVRQMLSPQQEFRKSASRDI